MAYTVRLQQFEGPLDLLLELIEKEKLDITEISLASVAEQYLEYLNNLQNISPGVLVNFLTVASKLILIKSRSILPTLEISEEEEEEIQDLKKQLEEYKKFKDASKIIGKIVEKNEKITTIKEGLKKQQKTYDEKIAKAIYNQILMYKHANLLLFVLDSVLPIINKRILLTLHEQLQ